MAVYGDVALATDRTVFKIADENGKISVRNEATVLRMFVKLNGKWVPAGAALVPIKIAIPRSAAFSSSPARISWRPRRILRGMCARPGHRLLGTKKFDVVQFSLIQ